MTPPKSPVWNYFTRDPTTKVASCKRCPAKYSNPATSVLYYHLESSHHIVLDKLKPKKQPRASSAPVSRTFSEEELVDNPEEQNQGQGGADAPNNDSSTSDTGSSAAGHRAGSAASTSSTSRPSAAASQAGPRSRPPSFDEGPLDRCLSNAAAFNRGGLRYEETTNALLYMIAQDNMPASTVERKGFQVFVRTLQPRYKPPSEPTLTKKMELKYQELKEAYGKKLAAAKCICLTTDLWTHKHTMSSHLGVVAHFREGKKMRTIEIAARPMPESKTADNIQVALREICREWHIDYGSIRGIVTDGGANIKNAVRNEFGSDKHIECVAHKLNNIGQMALGLKESKPPSEETFDEALDHANIPENEEEAIDFLDDLTEQTDDALSTSQMRPLIMRVKKIVRFFRQSEVATSELISLQEAEGKQRNECRKLIQEVRTRWNSAYEMVERFLDLADHVSMALLRVARNRNSRATPPTMLTSAEQDILVEIRDLLKPLAEATKLVSGDKLFSISSVIPMVMAMKKEIESSKPVSALAKSLKKKLLEQIELKLSPYELLRPYAGATLLDPRFKQWAFDSIRASSAIINHVGSKVSARVEANSRQFEETCRQRQQAAQDQPQSGLMSAIDRLIHQKTVGAPDQERTVQMPSQLKNYLGLMPVDRRSNPDPMELWESLKPGMEQLYEIAMDFLPLFATSVSCERLFSHAGLIATTLRNRISPKHLNQYVFLRSVGEDMWFQK